ncbi:MAG: hypothetical protein Q9M94_05165 [Candidatus Gracilibacteria bacterium]|nr:hypothetical protein [Candidatus Gracilibacteria bacterium]
MLDDIIKIDDRKDIIESLFKVLNSKTIKGFTKNYEEFKNILIEKNINDDKRLTRLYNRLYYVFSFVLNNLHPEVFPIYFGATRRGLRRISIEGYSKIQNVYIKFLENIENIEIFKNLKNEENEYIVKNYNEIKEIINEYKKLIALINEDNDIIKDNYIFKDNTIINFNKDLFENHAEYKCFQDICWMLSLEEEKS